MNRDFPPSNNKHPNAAESIVTSRHVVAAMQSIRDSPTIDPLEQFPALQRASIDAAKAIYTGLMAIGTPASTAAGAATRTYLGCAVVALAIHEALSSALQVDRSAD